MRQLVSIKHKLYAPLKKIDLTAVPLMTVGAVLVFLLGKNKVISPFADDYIFTTDGNIKNEFAVYFALVGANAALSIYTSARTIFNDWQLRKAHYANPENRLQEIGAQISEGTQLLTGPVELEENSNECKWEARPALGAFFEEHPLLWHGVSTLLRTTGVILISTATMSPPFLERVVDLIKDNLSFSMEEQTIFYGSYAAFEVLTLLLNWVNYHEMQMPLKLFLKEGENNARLRECKSALFSLLHNDQPVPEPNVEASRGCSIM
ncbi:Dot/Icm T4SS effector MceA [Coxiella burnetii]|uniref:Dot/Icm T4SS effector MceA n=1 Tax=Coxiella burnetii TaxID=777 RepID=UPI000163A178|nr:Dot/Icm T4SS effector MceA [Coxiella burnetii]ATN86668.1 hypothetical protein AYO29_09770 [Coxiella burnetii str. Schperling]EDR36499.1 hypothetical protein COXBURSA334_2009 [Coxiella burnetii Q321]